MIIFTYLYCFEAGKMRSATRLISGIGWEGGDSCGVKLGIEWTYGSVHLLELGLYRAMNRV